MQLLGPIAQLQIQRANLKHGPRGRSWYDPASIQPVPSVVLGAGGVIAWNAEEGILLDVHHRDHPSGKNLDGIHGISVLFTSHYRAMRARFGDHLWDGVAGESILVDCPHQVGLDQVENGLVIRTAAGENAHLFITQIAEPCVEFTRYSLRMAPDAREGVQLKDGLQNLRDGMRGFYAGYGGEPLTIRPGDEVFLP